MKDKFKVKQGDVYYYFEIAFGYRPIKYKRDCYEAGHDRIVKRSDGLYPTAKERDAAIKRVRKALVE